jgi:hypothetical protein
LLFLCKSVEAYSVARLCLASLAHAALVRRDHVLNVDEGIIAAVQLEHFEGLLDQVAQNEALPLPVVDAVAQVDAALLKEIHNGQQLPEVGHERLANRIAARDESLQNLQSDGHDLMITRVERS